MFVVEVPQHIWMRFHSISVCKVILEFRLESKLNKNDFYKLGGGVWIEKGRDTISYQVSTQDMLNLLTPQL